MRRPEAEGLVAIAWHAAESQWLNAGGTAMHITGTPEALMKASREAFAVRQAAAALDAMSLQVQQELRMLNATDGERQATTAPLIRAPAARKLVEDDTSDGCELQGELVRSRVVPGRPLTVAEPGEARAPDGTLRLFVPSVLSSHECALLLAGGVVAMAGAFSRCGQTTLGVSPALAARMRPSLELAGAVPMLYRTLERVRRLVASRFGTPLDGLSVSDATLTRCVISILLPRPLACKRAHARTVVDSLRRQRCPVCRRLLPFDHDAAADPGNAAAEPELELARATGSLDVGQLRGDRFVYSRPHIDQVSVQEYEYSALLYLTPQGEGGAFDGGTLVFHDEREDVLVRPRQGMLVSFTSGSANLHAVNPVTGGQRFALTMWFTTRPDPSAPSDPAHSAMHAWARDEADAIAAGLTPPLPPPPPHVPSDGVPAGTDCRALLLSRDADLASAALCSLPANDPLCQGLLLAHARGGKQLQTTLALGLSLPVTDAHCAPSRAVAARTTAAADGDAEVGRAGGNPAPATLKGRMAAYTALLTTLRRAQAAHGECGSKRPFAAPDRPARAGATDGFDVFDGAPSPPNAVPMAESAPDDGFDVFD